MATPTSQHCTSPVGLRPCGQVASGANGMWLRPGQSVLRVGARTRAMWGSGQVQQDQGSGRARGHGIRAHFRAQGRITGKGWSEIRRPQVRMETGGWCLRVGEV